MDMEEKESTETGSHSGNSEAESPEESNVGLNVAPHMEGVGVQQPPPPPPHPHPQAGGELKVKKKRGRPTKYDAEGNLRPQYMPGYSPSVSGNMRGRPTNFHCFASMGEVFAYTAGSDFLPHVVIVRTGEDVSGKLLSIAQKGPRGICILSANGTVSNVTIRQPGPSGGLLTYEGRFEILTLTGSFTPSENNGMKSRTGGLSISLAGPDGRVVGGGVAGGLLAANPIQVVFGSFMPNSCKVIKRKHHVEPRMAPVINNALNIVTEAMPVSQAAPASKISPLQTAPFAVQSHGQVNNSIINERENPNSTSTGSADYNNSGPTFDLRNYPDINVSISFD